MYRITETGKIHDPSDAAHTLYFCIHAPDPWIFFAMSSLLDKLRLDQKEAYISISATNEDGYDRWLSFYLSLPDDGESLSDKELEKKLRKEISTLSLYDKDGLVYTTDELLWASVQTDRGTYNLTLTVIPKIEELSGTFRKNIERITFQSESESREFPLDAYIIDAQETLPEEEFYISGSPMVTYIEDDLTDTLNYSILASDDAEEIESVTLVYEDGFAGITDASITQTEKKGNEISYEAAVSFYQKETGSAFRPFLKIKTVSGKEGLLVPPIPAYIDQNAFIVE